MNAIAESSTIPTFYPGLLKDITEYDVNENFSKRFFKYARKHINTNEVQELATQINAIICAPTTDDFYSFFKECRKFFASFSCYNPSIPPVSTPTVASTSASDPVATSPPVPLNELFQKLYPIKFLKEHLKSSDNVDWLLSLKEVGYVKELMSEAQSLEKSESHKKALKNSTMTKHPLYQKIFNIQIKV